MEKLKVVTTDKMFIDFVEKLQKMKLDLESLKQVGEIANAGYMGKIESDDIDLDIEGIGGKKSLISSKIYTVPIKIRGQVKDLKCYGMEVISSKASYKAMCERFGVQPVDVKRPSKIDLLI